jgi:putative phosphoribosyl transferase
MHAALPEFSGRADGVRMMTRTRFRNRVEAGRRLAAALEGYAGRRNLLILALPRGGVPVAFEVARALNAPMDVMLVRKLGVPGHEELAMGAIASGGIRILSDDVIAAFGITDRVIAAVAAQEQEELDRREKLYRDDRPSPTIRGRSIVLVDDGLATGSTMRAAALAIRVQNPEHLTVAVPVAPAETCAALRREVDEVICAVSPEPFFAVGNWYEDFSQTTDEEVHQLLERAGSFPEAASWR